MIEPPGIQLFPSTRIRNYEIIEIVGEGGHGKIYKGIQNSTQQEVAIKVLKFIPNIGEKKKKQQTIRFERETKLCAEMNHPNIVKLLDKGIDEQGELFAVFEYVSGETLKDHIIKNNGLSPRETFNIMGQVLDALVEAHKKGIVHRDLKPENIMITNLGVSVVAKVLDFGIGAITHELRTKDYQSLTLTKEMVGTPSYSAPEQLRGEPPVKSDLYAWGLVLVECLTGEPLIKGRSIAEIFQQQLNPGNIALPPSLIGHEIAIFLSKVLDKKSSTRAGNTSNLHREFMGINFQTLVGNLKPKTPKFELVQDTKNNDIRWTPRGNEKRQISVLAIKLSLSSTNNCVLDFEAIETIHKDQLNTCTDIAIRYGGFVAGQITDNILVYFGYPTVCDNDARRAGRTALEIVSQTKKRNQLLIEQHELTIGTQIGIHAGDILINYSDTPEGGGAQPCI